MTNANEPRRFQDRNGVSRWPAFVWRRNIVTDVVQGIIVGSVLAFITFQILMHGYVTKVNGWTTMDGCGEPGIGILLRGACAITFPQLTCHKKRCTGLWVGSRLRCLTRMGSVQRATAPQPISKTLLENVSITLCRCASESRVATGNHAALASTKDSRYQRGDGCQVTVTAHCYDLVSVFAVDFRWPPV